MGFFATLSITDTKLSSIECHYAECRYPGCCGTSSATNKIILLRFHLEDVDEFPFRRRLGSNRQHAVAEVLLLRLPAPAPLLQFPERGGGVLEPSDELLDVVEAAVQDGHVALVPVAGGGAERGDIGLNGWSQGILKGEVSLYR
jgi:hypothetical protein